MNFLIRYFFFLRNFAIYFCHLPFHCLSSQKIFKCFYNYAIKCSCIVFITRVYVF